MSRDDPVVRPARPEEVDALPAIERAAGLLFKTHPEDLGIPEEAYARTTSREAFSEAREAGRLWVAAPPAGAPVGFALVIEVGRYAHLDELDVLPSHGRRGIGSALLDAVCVWARDAGYAAVTLRTFRDVPWNAPFYRNRGFRVVDGASLSEEHVEIEAAERRRGLRTNNRVTMVRDTDR